MKTNTEMFDAAKNLKVGDVFEFHLIMRRPQIDEVRSALVSNINLDDERQIVQIIYLPCDRENSVRCGFGSVAIRPEDDNTHAKSKWGWQWVKKVGEQRLPRPMLSPSLFKNPGYDLVNL